MNEDEFQGQGGSYVVDQKTGKRKLVERTQEAETNPTTEEPSEAKE